ncbi:intein-containing RctB family protein [Candidatus Omnitrophota bacterium]
MAQAWSGTIEKIDDFRWRIPRSYKSGMRVPGVIYADEEMIKDIRADKAPEQVSNVAFLPGIVKYSLAMPDIHWGYGMPIGGVVATDIDNGGVVGAGIVGYDINCLSASTFVLNELGQKIRIKDYENIFHRQKLICMDFNKDRPEEAGILRFLKQKPKTTVLELLTETGRQIEATGDHPFYTRDGMKELKHLSAGCEIAVYPFEGVEYEDPGSEAIIREKDVRELLLKLGKSSRGNAVEQVINRLNEKNILPLRSDSPQLPHLLRIMGYCFGDGSLCFIGARNLGTVCFYGEKEDLEKIRDDLSGMGFCSGLYSRERHHKISTMYRTVEFDRREFCLKCANSGLAALLAALGVPLGNKCRKPYGVPQWLFKAPLWQKRLFLAGLFGAELSSPKTLTGHGYNFYCPILSMNKSEHLIENGRQFLRDISQLLSGFGIEIEKISERKEFVSKEGLVSYRLRLILSGRTDNLIDLYSKVGFEYNEKRKFLGNVAVSYLSLKNTIIQERKDIAELAPALCGSGKWQREQLFEYLTGPGYVSDRFIERSLYERRKTAPRMWGDDPTFDEYLKNATEGLGRSGMVWERIRSVVDIEYDDYVYDFTVDHPRHNFIANGFVVSNCGVRLMKTNMTDKEIRPKIKDLVYGLYNNVPAGVGSKGDIRVSGKEERKLLVDGSKWVVERGYGRLEDLEYTEENGAIKGADPAAVSERAYERGKSQSGTLGSGNHFLEIQAIDQIYDQEAADVLGLSVGQVTVMIHSGSRGLGYQVCDDYSRSMIRCLEKYKINVPDRQLACAPVNSPEGKSYLGAMRCAANYAWANRQCLMHLTREVFEKVLSRSQKDMGLNLIYDVAHNIAKIEKFNIDGKDTTVCIHRKGATRAFPPGHTDLPVKYKRIGQPVIIPGDMGRCSFLLLGTQKAEETFYSTCHGAGRLMSRSAAIRSSRGRSISRELEDKGVFVRSSGRNTLAEEMPEAYKDVNKVVNIVHNAGISKRVCRMRPMGVIKG